ncbi:MAG: hypothetical protein ACYSUT_00200 [Planctomycetota bacterium]|jgi:hypothetical protein
MISEKQLLANCQNAQLSTGPQTAAGKAISSQNAIKHGLRAENTVIPGEDHEEFDQFRQMLLEDLDPAGAMELFLADRIVAGFWKLRRAGRFETEMLKTLHDDDVSRQLQQQGSRRKRIQDDLEELQQAWQSHQFHHQNDYETVRKAWEASPEAAMIREDRWPTDPGHPTPDEVMKNFIMDHTLKLRQQRKKAFWASLDQKIADEDASDAVSQQAPVPEPAFGRIMHQDMRGSHILTRFQAYEGQIERSLYKALTELQKLQFLHTRQRVSSEHLSDRPSQAPED